MIMNFFKHILEISCIYLISNDLMNIKVGQSIILKKATYYLLCSLYKHDIDEQENGDSFDSRGFGNQKKKDIFEVHIT